MTDPAPLPARLELARARLARREMDQALELLQATAREDPEHGAGERWMAYMLAGRYEDAWRESDRVLRRRRENGERCDDRPHHLRWVWDGTPLAGRRVLIRCFHGLGDTIQFVRFAPHLARMGCRVVVEAVQELLPLLRRVQGIERLVPLGQFPLPRHEVAIESTELPHALRTTVETIPADVPYIHVAPAGVARSRRLQVGLVWESGRWAPHRSIPFETLAPVLALPGIDFHCLQRGPARDELPAAARARLVAGEDGSTDLLETARRVAALDVVISTDTMIAHLAGALAVPVWTLLAFQADWRWLVDRADSPWYPTMRLFRQPSPGDWKAVVGELIVALAGRSERCAA